MPIIAQQIIHINGSSDLSISVLDEISNCGCIQSELLAAKLNTPLIQLKNMLAHIVKENNLKCDADFKICCGDQVEFEKFVSKLKNIPGN